MAAAPQLADLTLALYTVTTAGLWLALLPALLQARHLRKLALFFDPPGVRMTDADRAAVLVGFASALAGVGGSGPCKQLLMGPHCEGVMAACTAELQAQGVECQVGAY